MSLVINFSIDKWRESMLSITSSPYSKFEAEMRTISYFAAVKS